MTKAKILKDVLVEAHIFTRPGSAKQRTFTKINSTLLPDMFDLFVFDLPFYFKLAGSKPLDQINKQSQKYHKFDGSEAPKNKHFALVWLYFFNL